MLMLRGYRPSFLLRFLLGRMSLVLPRAYYSAKGSPLVYFIHILGLRAFPFSGRSDSMWHLGSLGTVRPVSLGCFSCLLLMNICCLLLGVLSLFWVCLELLSVFSLFVLHL